MKKMVALLISMLFFITPTFGAMIIKMYKVTPQGLGEFVGTIMASDTQYGLLLTPDLKSLPAGLHGFHIHEHPNCGHTGEDAGGHLDPQHTDRHMGPYSEAGHLGDLPALYVDFQGFSSHPVLAPRLKLSDIKGHSLMIHAGGDNYSDTPEKNGGGGARLVCGVIE